MIVLASGLALAAGLLTTSVATQMAKKRKRKERFRGLELRPNCLLTRYPIAFLSGPRTIFRLFDHWNDIPLYLREHGYDVIVIEPSGATPEMRAQATLEALTSNSARYHLIADASLEAEVDLIAEKAPTSLISLTVVTNSERSKSDQRLAQTAALSVAALRPRRIAVESFEVQDSDATLGFESAKPSLLELTNRLLLKCHNLALRGRTAAVDALETAEFGLFRGFRNEERFLNLAVSLAERDLSSGE